MAQTPLSASVSCSYPSAPIVRISTTGGNTTDRSQTITGTFSNTGTVSVGQQIEIDDNGMKIGTATVAANGGWSDDVLLSDLGTNTLTASATGPNGRVGTSAPVTITLDTVLSPPQAGPATLSPSDRLPSPMARRRRQPAGVTHSFSRPIPATPSSTGSP